MAKAHAVSDEILPSGFDQVAFVAFPLSTLRRLQEEAQKRDQSVSTLIAHALDLFLSQSGPRTLTEDKE